jgi:hypothetical protein
MENGPFSAPSGSCRAEALAYKSSGMHVFHSAGLQPRPTVVIVYYSRAEALAYGCDCVLQQG